MQHAAQPIINKLANFVSPRVVGEIRRELFKDGRAYSKVLATIKTHKPDLQCRSIHSSSGSILAGISRYVARTLKVITDQYVHCAKSSSDVIRLIKSTFVTEGSLLMKLDLKDFYMSTDHDSGVASCVAEVEKFVSNRDWLPYVLDINKFDVKISEDAMYFLLRNQFVDPMIPGFLYQCVCGSGMGSEHSSAISSINFKHNVEERFLDSPIPRVKNGLQLYVRYHDDILLVCSDPDSAKCVLSEFCRLVNPHYRIDLEEVSNNGVAMLDLLVYKNCNVCSSNRLSYQPYIKPSARHVPLAPTIEQHSHVHLGWPISEVRRMWKLFENVDHFREFRQLKVDRFRRFGIPDHILARCLDWAPPFHVESTRYNFPLNTQSL